jgi:L-amino acid N-acyltransferase YncA
MHFSAEAFSDHIEAARRLGAAHWAELYGETPFPAELEKLADLQRQGGFAYYVAKVGDEVVGHVGFFLIYSPVHAARMAIDAFYYVVPEHRRNGTARKLLAFAGQALQATGVPNVFASALRGSNLAQIIESAGYERSATMYRFQGA